MPFNRLHLKPEAPMPAEGLLRPEVTPVVSPETAAPLGELALTDELNTVPKSDRLDTEVKTGDEVEKIQLGFELYNGDKVVDRFAVIAAREGHVLLANDPAAREGLLSDGPSYFDRDDVRHSGRTYAEVSGRQLPDRTNGEYFVSTAYVDEEGGIHHGDVRAKVISSSGSFTQTEVQRPPASGSGNEDNTGGVDFARGELSYAQQGPYFNTVEIRQVFEALGFSPGVIPTPKTFKARMDYFRQNETASGVYYPKIRLIPAAGIKADPYLSAYAAKEHAVATKAFRFYHHDIASEHLQALMKDGEPLMDLLAAFAQVALNPKAAIAFNFQRISDEKMGVLIGEDKLKRATVTIDAMTMLMAKRDAKYNTTQGELTNVANCIVDAVKSDRKRVKKIPFIAAMLKTKRIKSVKELTGAVVVDEITRLTQQRLPNDTADDRLHSFAS